MQCYYAFNTLQCAVALSRNKATVHPPGTLSTLTLPLFLFLWKGDEKLTCTKE